MAGGLDEKHREGRFDSLIPVAATDVNMGLVNSNDNDNNNNSNNNSSSNSNNHGVPTPPLSPCASMTCLARPPTQGGGPLSSHPTTPTDIPGAWLSTSDLQALGRAQATAATTTTTSAGKAIAPPLNLAVCSTRLSAPPSVSADHMEPSRHDSFRTPLTPASANNQRRGSKAIRKLLSLSGLRNSFASSASNDDAVIAPSSTSPSLSSPNVSNASSLFEDSFREGTVSRGTKRSASTSMSLTPPEDHHQNQPPSSPLRKRKSIGWFRRTSHIFLFGDGDDTNAQSEPLTKSISKSEVNMDHDSTAPARRISRIPHLSQSPEDAHKMSTMSNIQPKQRNFTAPELYHAQPPLQSRPHTSQPPQPSEDREAPQIQEPPRTSHTHKAPETFEAPPRLPELDTLGGGSLGDGFLDAEDMFANIGR